MQPAGHKKPFIKDVLNTNALAKAGVMIRETLDPGSRLDISVKALAVGGNGIAKIGMLADQVVQ